MLMSDSKPPNNLVDSVFMAISAMSGAGLTTIPMYDVSVFGTVCIYLLMLMGGIAFLLFPPVLYRLHQYRRFKPMVQQVLELRQVIRARAGEAGADDGDAFAGDLLGDFELQDEALQVLARVLFCYNFCGLVVSSFVFYAVLLSYGPLPALVNEDKGRRISHAWFSTFAAVSSFNNVGFSILNDNYVQLSDRPGCLLLMSVLIVCGNTGLPIALRTIVYVLSLLRPGNRAIRFILDNPRRCTTAFFTRRETYKLAVVLAGNLVLQYAFYLATSMHRPGVAQNAVIGPDGTVADVRYPPEQLAVQGFFTAVSTRAAGMNVYDLRLLSKAHAVVMCVMMYVAAAPHVALMQASKQTVVAKVVKGEVLLVYEGGEEEGSEETEAAVYKKYLSSHFRWLGVIFLILATAEQRVMDIQFGCANPPTTCFPNPKGSGLVCGRPDNFADIDSGVVTHVSWICSAAGPSANPNQVNLFDVLFEVMSAYGTSGLSMGSGRYWSLCGEFNNFSKILLCVVKIMGKHRGLPSSTDAALDGQFHKIHGILEQLQVLAKEQLGEAQGAPSAHVAKGGYQPLAEETPGKEKSGDETDEDVDLGAGLSVRAA